jgi:hypothetical protein
VSHLSREKRNDILHDNELRPEFFRHIAYDRDQQIPLVFGSSICVFLITSVAAGRTHSLARRAGSEKSQGIVL